MGATVMGGATAAGGTGALGAATGWDMAMGAPPRRFTDTLN